MPLADPNVYGGLDPYAGDASTGGGYNEMIDLFRQKKLADALRFSQAADARSKQQIYGGVGGEMVGAGRYQHYVPNYGAPLQGLAANMGAQRDINRATSDQASEARLARRAYDRDLERYTSPAEAQGPLNSLVPPQRGTGLRAPENALPLTMGTLSPEIAPDPKPEGADITSSEVDSPPDEIEEIYKNTLDVDVDSDETQDAVAADAEEGMLEDELEAVAEEKADPEAETDTAGAAPADELKTTATSLQQQPDVGFSEREKNMLRMISYLPATRNALNHAFVSESTQRQKALIPQKRQHIGRGLILEPDGTVRHASEYEASLDKASQRKQLEQELKASNQMELEAMREAGRANTRESRQRLLEIANEARAKSDQIKLQMAKIHASAKVKAAGDTAKGMQKVGWFKVPADVRKKWDESNEGYSRATDAIDGLKSYPDAVGLKGFLPGWTLVRIDPKGVGPRADMAALTTKVRHDLSGAAITQAEFKYLTSFIPVDTDTYAAAMDKLQKFKTGYRKVIERHRKEIRAGGAEPPYSQFEDEAAPDDPELKSYEEKYGG